MKDKITDYMSVNELTGTMFNKTFVKNQIGKFRFYKTGRVQILCHNYGLALFLKPNGEIKLICKFGACTNQLEFEAKKQ